jgi:hypothetical protein
MRQKVLIAILPVLFAAGVHATVLVPTDVAELTRDARAVARGEVVAVDGRWTDDRRTVETLVTLQTERYLKGQFGQVLQFRVPGGRMGRYRNVVVGAPTFAVGQHVIVFLGGNGPQVPYVLGLNQGVYRIGVTSSGVVMVTPPPIGGDVAGPVVRGTSQRQPAPLADFEQSILAFAGGAR